MSFRFRLQRGVASLFVLGWIHAISGCSFLVDTGDLELSPSDVPTPKIDSMEPEFPLTGNILKVEFSHQELEGLRHTVEWDCERGNANVDCPVDQLPIQALQLHYDHTAKGQRWTVHVIPWRLDKDGKQIFGKAASRSVEILNTPAQIETVGMSSYHLIEGTSRVRANVGIFSDEDGDAMNLQFCWFNDGGDVLQESFGPATSDELDLADMAPSIAPNAGETLSLRAYAHDSESTLESCAETDDEGAAIVSARVAPLDNRWTRLVPKVAAPVFDTEHRRFLMPSADSDPQVHVWEFGLDVGRLVELPQQERPGTDETSLNTLVYHPSQQRAWAFVRDAEGVVTTSFLDTRLRGAESWTLQPTLGSTPVISTSAPPTFLVDEIGKRIYLWAQHEGVSVLWSLSFNEGETPRWSKHTFTGTLPAAISTPVLLPRINERKMVLMGGRIGGSAPNRIIYEIELDSRNSEDPLARFVSVVREVPPLRFIGGAALGTETTQALVSAEAFGARGLFTYDFITQEFVPLSTEGAGAIPTSLFFDEASGRVCGAAFDIDNPLHPALVDIDLSDLGAGEVTIRPLLLSSGGPTLDVKTASANVLTFGRSQALDEPSIDRRLVIYGGGSDQLWAFDLNDDTWATLEVEGDPSTEAKPGISTQRVVNRVPADNLDTATLKVVDGSRLWELAVRDVVLEPLSHTNHFSWRDLGGVDLSSVPNDTFADNTVLFDPGDDSCATLGYVVLPQPFGGFGLRDDENGPVTTLTTAFFSEGTWGAPFIEPDQWSSRALAVDHQSMTLFGAVEGHSRNCGDVRWTRAPHHPQAPKPHGKTFISSAPLPPISAGRRFLVSSAGLLADSEYEVWEAGVPTGTTLTAWSPVTTIGDPPNAIHATEDEAISLWDDINQRLLVYTNEGLWELRGPDLLFTGP